MPGQCRNPDCFISVKPPVFDRQDGNLDCAPLGLVSNAGAARSDPLLMQLLAAFLDDIKLIGFHIAEGLLQPTGPSDLYSVRLRGATQTEVQTQIALRDVAAATAHLLQL